MNLRIISSQDSKHFDVSNSVIFVAEFFKNVMHHFKFIGITEINRIKSFQLRMIRHSFAIFIKYRQIRALAYIT